MENVFIIEAKFGPVSPVLHIIFSFRGTRLVWVCGLDIVRGEGRKDWGKYSTEQPHIALQTDIDKELISH